MPVPRRRHSRARQAKRRTHYKLGEVQTAKCENCGEPKRSHRVCPNCGVYKHRENNITVAKPRPNIPEA